VNPTPIGEGGSLLRREREREPGRLILGLAEGTEVMGASSSTRSSPYSEIVEAPGLGKKIERLRECRRACLREGLGSGGNEEELGKG